MYLRVVKEGFKLADHTLVLTFPLTDHSQKIVNIHALVHIQHKSNSLIVVQFSNINLLKF